MGKETPNDLLAECDHKKMLEYIEIDNDTGVAVLLSPALKQLFEDLIEDPEEYYCDAMLNFDKDKDKAMAAVKSLERIQNIIKMEGGLFANLVCPICCSDFVDLDEDDWTACCSGDKDQDCSYFGDINTFTIRQPMENKEQ